MQIPARVPEGGQRVGLTAGAVQRQHEQAAQPLPQRMVGDEVPQFRDQVGVIADREVKLDAFLQDADARFGEPVALRVQVWAVQTVADRSAPEPQRSTQRLGRLPR